MKMTLENGLNFLGSDRELKELFNKLDTDQKQRQSSYKKSSGNFILQMLHILVEYMKQ